MGTLRSAGRGRAALVAVVTALVLYPWFAGAYATDLMSQALLFAMLAISVDLLWGFAGILNLAPAAYFGLGAYAYALSLKYLPAAGAVLAGLGLSMVLPGVLALVVGYASFKARSTQIYFALITLAVGLGLEKVVLVWYSFTGGSNGMTGVVYPSIPGVIVASPTSYYYLVAAVVGVVYWFSHRLVGSPLGRVLTAVRENELRAQAVGYNTTQYKLTVSVLSAVIGGLAGALTTPLVSMAHPSQFSVLLSMQAFVWVAVGGQGTLAGPFLAAVGIKLLESWLSGLSAWTYLLILGLVFVLVVSFYPDGLAGALRRRRAPAALSPPRASPPGPAGAAEAPVRGVANP